MTGLEGLFTALSFAGGALGAVGQIAAGQAEARAAKYNAKVQEQQARQEREAAAVEAEDFRREERRKQAAAGAARAATGVTGAGSPLLVDEATVREIALGASRYRYRGAVRSNRLMQEAELSRMRGKAASTAGYIGAGSSLLSSLGSFGDY